MDMIDEYVEDKLQDKSFFETVIPKAMSFYCSHEVYRLRLYNIMAMRLGHATGSKMTYKAIASVTMGLRFNKPLSANYCRNLYIKGLRLSRRAIDALGRVEQ